MGNASLVCPIVPSLDDPNSLRAVSDWFEEQGRYKAAQNARLLAERMDVVNTKKVGDSITFYSSERLITGTVARINWGFWEVADKDRLWDVSVRSLVS